MSSLLTDALGLLTLAMVWIIAVGGLAEAMLFVHVRQLCRAQLLRVRDTLANLSKGLADRPDRDSLQAPEDQIRAATAHLQRVLAAGGPGLRIVRHALAVQGQKNSLQALYPLEARANLASAMVQVFPLLGILGTILALNQAAFADGSATLAASAITRAFVVAIDTTILGLLLAVIFTIWEAGTMARVGRVLEATQRCQDLLDQLTGSAMMSEADEREPPMPRALAAPGAG